MKIKNRILRKKKYFNPNNYYFTKKLKNYIFNFEYIYENINIVALIIKSVIIIIVYIIFIYFPLLKVKLKNSKLKVALCTMGRNENLYVNEFVNYYISIGVDKLFLYDDNVEESEKFYNVLPKQDTVDIIYNREYDIEGQIEAFNHCYKTNKDNYDWFIMVDMDEFLVIKNNDTVKQYLSDKVFDKCDFIKLHWRIPSDNNLLYYENKSLFERFKRPFRTDIFIKSIIRGHIDKLKYWVHSPYYSPDKNITCDNAGNILHYKKLNFQNILKVNLDRAYFLHFFFKSTEEYINKFKRGYKDWPHLKLDGFIINYFRNNKLTIEKVEMLEKAFNITLEQYRHKLHLSL